MRYLTVLAGIGALLVFSAKAQTEKPNFTGSWQMSPAQTAVSNGGAFLLWMKVEQKGADIHVSRGWKGADGNEVVTDVRCKTNGDDCDVNGAKVSFYYSGNVLTELEVAGDTIVKRLWTLDAACRCLQLEVRHVEPAATADLFMMDKAGAVPVTF
jgi:hypothetical protein